MRTIILSLFIALFATNANCSDHTFLLYDVNKKKVLVSEGRPEEQISPCSTFKIALAIMGFESGHFKSPENPKWPYRPEVHEKWAVVDTHKQDLTPQTWMSYSAVWYSQELTKKLGEDEFAGHVRKLKYGNMDVSGEPGKNNGLTTCWLGSSLKISAQGQVDLLTKLALEQLPFSPQAQQLTRQIVCLGDFDNGWKLFGKTGSGYMKNADGVKDPNFMHGWFVGWLEKGDQKLVFAYHLNNIAKERGFGGPVAKTAAIERLKVLVADK